MEFYRLRTELVIADSYKTKLNHHQSVITTAWNWKHMNVEEESITILIVLTLSLTIIIILLMTCKAGLDYF